MKNGTQVRNGKKRRCKIGIGIMFVIVLVVIVLGVTYIQSLVNLVHEESFTGDPSIPESDIGDPAETTTPDISAAPTPHPSATDGVSTTTTEPKETTISQQELARLAAEADLEAAIADIPVIQNKSVYNILLIGTDNRGNEKNGRSDTMMILSVNKKTNQIHIVSLMRALYVKIPNHEFSMLNAAFSWGGPSLLLKTINENFRIKVDDYVLIDFSGFIQAIDAAGGVDINLTEAEVAYLLSYHPDRVITVGVNHLDGILALEYARIRKIDSDFRRTGRQRNLIEAMIRKMSAMSAADLDALARQILPLVRTNRTGSSLVSLAVDSLSFSGFPISQLMLPINGTHDMMIVRGVQMERFDAKANIEALQNFLYGS